MDRKYPWYDSCWLDAYVLAKDFIRQNHPEKLNDFVHAFDVFRTDPDFRIKQMPRLFDENTINDLKTIIKSSWRDDSEIDEYGLFGRLVLRDLPIANELQQRITGLVSSLVDEPVEPCYNFLSLYKDPGVCGVHMDAPLAKWTVDLCIEQSTSWPIYFSKVVPWPEDWTNTGEGWQQSITDDPANQFESYEIKEGDAIVFAGSSQWHYRNPIDKNHAENFCHLLFFHYIPAGTSELADPMNWARIFDIPDLSELKDSFLALDSGFRFG